MIPISSGSALENQGARRVYMSSRNAMLTGKSARGSLNSTAERHPAIGTWTPRMTPLPFQVVEIRLQALPPRLSDEKSSPGAQAPRSRATFRTLPPMAIPIFATSSAGAS